MADDFYYFVACFMDFILNLPNISLKNLEKMKNILHFTTVILIILIASCTNVQSQNAKTSLPAAEYFEKMKVNLNAPILDVRTPDEFSKGHLTRAVNINFNDANFAKNISEIDKNKPVFVYCLSGGRSGKAATQMRNEGFKEVYEMEGGMMKWRAANLPETANSTLSAGMSLKEFEALYQSEKPVLIDFYANWCEPCMKMKPFLLEMEKEMGDKITFVRIDVDQNANLTKELKIDALPTILFYKNKQKVWQNYGFLSREELTKKLN